MRAISQRLQRPQGHDYLADIRQRFGPLGMVHLAALGTTGTEQRKPYQVVERIAVIQIQGLLSNDAYWWDETDYRDVQEESLMAAEDGDVDAILHVYKSPGGYTDNAFETADVLAEVAKKKPLWAVANTIAYSAAYLLASQAAKVYVPQHTGGVGSVGVYTLHADYSEMLKKAGIKVTLISEGEGKVDGNPYEPLSERAESDARTEMRRLYGLFVAAVSRGRKLTESQVRKLGAYCYEGSHESLGVGLADVAGTAEEALAALAAHLQESKKSLYSAAASVAVNPHKEVSTMSNTNQSAGSQQPDAAATAAANAGAATQSQMDKARQEGREAAMAEVQEIESLCALAGSPALAAKFLADNKSPAQVRAELLQAKAKAGGEGGEVNNQVNGGTSAKPAGTLKERMLGTLKKEGRI